MLAYFTWNHQEEASQNLNFDTIPPCGRYLKAIKRKYPYSDLVYKPKLDLSHPLNKEAYSTKATVSSEDNEKKAIKEVYEAIDKLREDPKITSLTLKPQNSFIRRIQHKKVHNKPGFSSKSTGIKPNRSLKITRDTLQK